MSKTIRVIKSVTMKEVLYLKVADSFDESNEEEVADLVDCLDPHEVHDYESSITVDSHIDQARRIYDATWDTAK